VGKMEQALKSEITRLAKKEMRATYVRLARDVCRLKHNVSALRKTVAVLARLGSDLQAERQAQRAKLAAAPEEVKASRISPGLIKKLRARLGITQGELATLVGVSTSAVGSWQYGKARPKGRNRDPRCSTVMPRLGISTSQLCPRAQGRGAATSPGLALIGPVPVARAGPRSQHPAPEPARSLTARLHRRCQRPAGPRRQLPRRS